jgi:hypothetical protein
VSFLEAHHLTRADDTPATPPDTWRQAALYLGQGLAVVRRTPGLYLLITSAYAMPALLAGAVAAYASKPVVWQQAIVLGLPWITVVLGAVVIMVAVGYQARGQEVDLARATRVGVCWVPRYVWTNVHTSLIFWVPIGMLFAAREWQAKSSPASGAADTVISSLWWLAIACCALYLHTRTVLAPFLAVHADLPGTLAALEAWRLAGRNFPVCLATFVLGSLPVALPLGLLALILTRDLSGRVYEVMAAATPELAWVGIQAVRPVLIAALYPLYRDLWQRECARRTLEGAERVPPPARVLLAITRPLPKLGGWD